MMRDVLLNPESVSPDEVIPQPWANGLGLTRVLADRLAWRVSIAEIRGRMPFSALPETDRILIPLSDAHIDLTVDGVRRRVPRTTGITFSGDSRVFASTGRRRVSVLNVMTRRRLARTAWTIRQHDETVTVPTGVTVTALIAGVAAVDGRVLTVGTVLLPSTRTREIECRDATLAQFSVTPALPS